MPNMEEASPLEPLVEKYLQKAHDRYIFLEKKICEEAAQSTSSESYRAIVKEMSYLKPILDTRARLLSAKEELLSSEKLLSESESKGDASMSALAREEIARLKDVVSGLSREILSAILPPDGNDGKDIILEIRAGTGGEEAAIFAGDLARLYTRFAANQGLQVEVMDSNPTSLNGFKEIIFSIKGKRAWRLFRYESGVHRVQRVPVTESSGRIHTSAATVAVLPEAEEGEVKIDEKDLRIDTYRSSGAGGQHVNKTDSAVRITHLPSGLVVACQEERSQIKNRARAMKILMAKLADIQRRKVSDEISDMRKKQVGTGDRSEKIRTYNFPQNRITDHRINFTIYNLEAAMGGGKEFMEIIERLDEASVRAVLSSEISAK